MTPAQRAALVNALPLSPPDAHKFVPEGDDHVDGAVGTRDTLRMLYHRSGRKIYVGSGVSVFYPEEERFAPDVIAVTDVEPHNRSSWVVSAEGKGVDFALEVLVSGDRRKDLEGNVVRYASLGISEYFIFDRRKRHLHGYRLASPGLRTYTPIVPQVGRYASRVLGLDLSIVGARLRFYVDTAMVLQSDEIIHALEESVEGMALAREEEALLREDAERRAEVAERAREGAERAREEAERAREEAERRAEAAERAQGETDRQLQALRVELEALRGR
jgi:Uma2 family endonuclease